MSGWLLCALLLLLPLGVQAQDKAASEPTLEVRVEGLGVDLPGELADNIRAYLAIARIVGQPVPMISRLRYLHRQAPQQIRQALQPFGYYSPRIESSLEETSGHWVALYRVDPGEPVRLHKVTIEVEGEARSDPAFAALLKPAALVPGAVLNHADYESQKSRMQSLAADRGYYEARFTRQQLLVDPQHHQADIALVLDSGPRYRIGQVHFTDGPVDHALLQRYLPFKPGDPVSSSRLLELQRGLADSEYFSRVEVQPKWDQAVDQVVPVEVNLEPNKRTAYRFGVGYGTDTGARVSASQKRRWVNHRGHSFDASLQLSQANSKLALQYNVPGRRPQTDRYSARLARESEHTNTTDSQSTKLGVLWQKKLDPWQRLTSLDWEHERFTLDNETTNTNFLIPSVRWSMTRTDNPLNPSHGYRLSLRLSAASQQALSDADFVQAQFGAKKVVTLGERTRLLARADLGATEMDNFQLMPSTHRFFAGGDTSVRGYDYKALGPTGPNGDVVGGRYLAVGSAEVDYRVADQWRVAAFYDIGNAFDSLSESFKRGAGFGVRWQSPIGPVRVDLAFPQQASGFRIHFTLGPDL